MSEHIPGGGFTIARKIFHSNIWDRDPLYLKIWIWIIGRASYFDHEKKGKFYERGEFVTTYGEISKANAYIKNKSRIFPTLKQVRIILKWLENKGMISVKPLKSEPFPTGADTTAGTRAYVGLKITVINYDTYQNLESYKGRHKGRHLSPQGQYNNKGENKGYNPDFLSFKKRYSSPHLIDQTLEAIKSTRKTRKVSPNVLNKLFEQFEKYPPETVERGCQTYLDKKCAAEGKGEKYLVGIIRRKFKNQSTQGAKYTPPPPLREGEEYEGSGSTE
jgi:hypothetical protein